MPTVENPTLTLTTVNATNSKIKVTFNARFSPFERQCAGLGLKFHPHITVLGMDGTVGTDLFPYGPGTPNPDPLFPHTDFAVTVGTTDQVIAYNQEKPCSRNSLQEDSGGDEDEIKCKIRIHSVGLPLEFTEDVFTPQQVLLG